MTPVRYSLPKPGRGWSCRLLFRLQTRGPADFFRVAMATPLHSFGLCMDTPPLACVRYTYMLRLTLLMMRIVKLAWVMLASFFIRFPDKRFKPSMLGLELVVFFWHRLVSWTWELLWLVFPLASARYLRLDVNLLGSSERRCILRRFF